MTAKNKNQRGAAPDSWLPPRRMARVTFEPSGPRIQGRMSSIVFPCIQAVNHGVLTGRNVCARMAKMALVSVLQMQAGRGTCVLLPSTPEMKSPTANAPLKAELTKVDLNQVQPDAPKTKTNSSETLPSQVPLHTSAEPSRRGKSAEPATPSAINTYTITSSMLLE
jgi:hypothetical protein